MDRKDPRAGEEEVEERDCPDKAKDHELLPPIRSEIRPPATCPATPQRSIRVMIRLAIDEVVALRRRGTSAGR